MQSPKDKRQEHGKEIRRVKRFGGKRRLKLTLQTTKRRTKVRRRKRMRTTCRRMTGRRVVRMKLRKLKNRMSQIAKSEAGHFQTRRASRRRGATALDN